MGVGLQKAGSEIKIHGLGRRHNAEHDKFILWPNLKHTYLPSGNAFLRVLIYLLLNNNYFKCNFAFFEMVSAKY